MSVSWLAVSGGEVGKRTGNPVFGGFGEVEGICSTPIPGFSTATTIALLFEVMSGTGCPKSDPPKLIEYRPLAVEITVTPPLTLVRLFRAVWMSAPSVGSVAVSGVVVWPPKESVKVPAVEGTAIV